ncbi:MAG: hypothetical protein AB8B65_09660 [Kordia sp.]
MENLKEIYDLPRDIVIEKIDQDLKDEDKLECPKCEAVMHPNIL